MRIDTAIKAGIGCVVKRPQFFAVTALWLATVAGAATAEDFRIGGTGNALGAMRLLGDAYSKLHPKLSVKVMSSLGSSGAIKAIPSGAIDVGVSSRPLTDAERGSGAIEFEYARTPLVFAVSTKSKVRELTMDQLADIYSGKLANWPDGSLIRPILRQGGDDNTRQVREMSPALDKALTTAAGRPGLPFATTDQEAADKAESIPGALSVTTMSLINSESRQLRPLILNGVEPTVGNAASGKYPYTKRLFLITRPEPSPATRGFVAFLKSPAGRAILIRAGNWIP